MRYHDHIKDDFFYKTPFSFNKNTDVTILKHCLGGCLYMPATKDISTLIVEGTTRYKSLVLCFEDAIIEQDVGRGISNLTYLLNLIADKLRSNDNFIDTLPLIFVRVRSLDMFKMLTDLLTAEQLRGLTGFVFPKVSSGNLGQYISTLLDLNNATGLNLYAMPILEGERLAYTECRLEELQTLKRLCDKNSDLILNIRVGGTDFSSIFGVRRSVNFSIYDVKVVANILADIQNIFGRAKDGYVVSGPVWEYFLSHHFEELEQSSNQSVFASIIAKERVVNIAVDGLLRELLLDLSNGFIGKTVIHPSHLKYVNGSLTVTREDYDDAKQIMNSNGGVMKSLVMNKMNEVKPHTNWSKRTLQRANIYGVLYKEEDYFKIFAEEYEDNK